jgi:hypothetical protein
MAKGCPIHSGASAQPKSSSGAPAASLRNFGRLNASLARRA